VQLKVTGLNATGDEYLGQWVALEGDALIAHGANAREVYLAARQAGSDAPYLVHITPKTDPYIGGWYARLHQLDFDTLHNYGPDKNSLEIPVTLHLGRSTVKFPARLDTGAAFCVFERGWDWQ
jgi:Family of unknown function (DUF5678)